VGARTPYCLCSEVKTEGGTEKKYMKNKYIEVCCSYAGSTHFYIIKMILCVLSNSVIMKIWDIGYMDVVEALLLYRNANKNNSANFRARKNISYFKILINQRTHITYNENIACFNVFNMSVILLLDIGV
jgi:hypothetical protein